MGISLLWTRPPGQFPGRVSPHDQRQVAPGRATLAVPQGFSTFARLRHVPFDEGRTASAPPLIEIALFVGCQKPSGGARDLGDATCHGGFFESGYRP